MPAPQADPPLDIAILGAGPVGCAAALALQGSRHRLAIFDAAPAPAGLRPIALSHASRLILERLGIWPALVATPIETVQVSQSGTLGRARLCAREAGVPALGYVVDYAALAQALRAGLDVQPPSQAAPAARCTIHAEGAASHAMRERRYAQDAIVGLVRLAAPAGRAAFERFTAEGPLALLPMGSLHAFIWSASPARAAALAAMPEGRFLAELSAALGPRTGRAVALEQRSVQPLVFRARDARVAERAVYVGNAAQALHPVAGQGLNLGLRDAWDLARDLREADDPGERALLARYAASRRLDAAATIFVTELLSARAESWPGAARSIAMCALEALPPLRRFFTRRMIYGPSALP
jgi:2-octaprenyl-6-methoxyphenol hydroxylase